MSTQSESTIIIICVAVIAIIQLRILWKNRQKIDLLKSTFNNLEKAITIDIYVPRDELHTTNWKHVSEYLSLYANQPEEEAVSLYETITIVRLTDEESHPILAEIENAINTYLLHNKGSASDFNLIKDIVERYTSAVQREIDSLTPIPLYLGLMGTVAGIVVGLALIALTGDGFEAFVAQPDAVIGSLMSGVALAMLASFIGILCTTSCSWMDKNGSTVLEAGKNHFYTWIQTELLPVISNSATGAIALLSRNLSKINTSLEKTVRRLDTKLGEIGKTYDSQVELLHLMNEIDINKIATANVRTLAALNSAMGNLQQFATFLDNSSEYVKNVRALNDDLNAHMERTDALVEIAQFYRQHHQVLSARQDTINQAVVKVDDTLQKTLADLTQHAEKAMQQMHQTFIRCSDQIERAASALPSSLTEQKKQLELAVETIGKMPAIATTLKEMKQSHDEQNAALRELSKTLREMKGVLKKTPGQPPIVTPPVPPKVKTEKVPFWKGLSRFRDAFKHAPKK